MSNRGFIAVVAAVAFVALLGYGIVAKNGPSIEVGQKAPDAPVERLDGSGETSLADYRGKWVLVNFWASWCEPCRIEAPTIERFSRQNEGKVVVIGMDVKDETGAATKFAQEYGLSYELLHDGDGNRMDAYAIKALPESFLVDPEGNLALIARGVIDKAYLDQQVMPLIDGEGT